MRWYYDVHTKRGMYTYVATSWQEAVNMDFQASKACSSIEEHAKTCGIDKFPWRDEFPNDAEIKEHLKQFNGGYWEARTQWFDGKPEIIRLTASRPLIGRALDLVSSTATYRPLNNGYQPCPWPLSSKNE